MKKLIVVLVLSLIAFSAFLLASQLAQPGPVTQTITKATQADVSLMLFPQKGSFSDKFSLNVLLLNEEKTLDGVDVIINYDREMLAVEVGDLKPGTLFEEVVQKVVNQEKGEIRFSALTFSSKVSYGILASVNFRILKEGATTIDFAFSPGETTDSNVAEHGSGNDVLTKVFPGVYQLEVSHD